MKQYAARFVLVFISIMITLTGCTKGDPLGVVGVNPPSSEESSTPAATSDPGTSEEKSGSQTTSPDKEEEKEREAPPPLAVEGVDNVKGFVDFSGVWLTWSTPMDSICKGSLYQGRTDRCDFNYGSSLDWMELRPKETRVTKEFIEVDYEGEYHHYHGFIEQLEQYKFRMDAHFEEYVYPLEGKVTYSLDEGWIEFGMSGELPSTPKYDQIKTIGISGEGDGFGIIRSRDAYDPGEKRKKAKVPADNNYTFRFGWSETAKGTEGEAPKGLVSSTDSMRFVNDLPQPVFFRYFYHESQPLQATGTISGKVEHKFSITIDKGTVQLFEQENDTKPVRTVPIIDEEYSFKNVPVFVEDTKGGSKGLRRAVYTVKVIHAEADVDEKIFGQPVAYFRPDQAYNVLVPDEVDFKLAGMPEVGIKLSLIDRLTEIGKINYTEQEQRAKDWVDQASKDEMTDVNLEQLRRGIWAERVVREGAESAEAILGMTLKSFGNLMAELYGDLVDVQSQRLASSRQFQKKQDAFWEGKMDVENAPKLLGIDPKNRGKYSAALDKLAKKANYADAAGTSNKITKLLQFAIFDGLKLAGIDTDDAKQYSKWFIIAFRTFLDYVATDSLKGSTTLVKTTITHLVESVRPIIFDNRGELDVPDPYMGKIQFDERLVSAFPSYTRATKPLLKMAVDDMIDWDTANFDEYMEDTQATAEVLNKMIDKAVEVETSHHYLTAITNTADLSADVFELLENAHPWFKVMKTAMVILKYGTNAASIIDPAVFFFKTAPDYTREGVLLAFGRENLISMPYLPDPDPTNVIPVTVRKQYPNNVQSRYRDIENSGDEYKNLVAQLSGLLRDDELGEAIELTSGEGQDSLVHVRDEYNSIAGILINQALSAGSGFYEGLSLDQLQDSFSQLTELNVLEADMAERMWNLYGKSILEEYESADDPYYIAERNRIIVVAESLRKKIDELNASLGSLSASLASITMLPVVTVDFMIPESTDSGADTIMKSSEEFIITANIENAGSVPVSNMAALLTVVSPEDTVTITGDAMQPVGTGTLAADDGVYGSGEDSAEVVWEVNYTGDLTDETIMLKVDLVENGGEPVSFMGFEDQQFLMVDPLITDSDFDGMLDEYEQAYGLDTNMDDSQEDKDNDGLTNIREFRLGTDAGKKDTDDDGLSDGEESRGGDDGFITDPLNADTDGDGVDDKKDGAPNDPNSTEAGERPLEPVISVDTRVVTLTPEEPVAMVIISNTGEGDLYWVATSLNDALAITNPDMAEVNKGQLLIISVPPGFIFEAQETAETIVRIIDAFGLDTDFVDITVRVGRNP